MKILIVVLLATFITCLAWVSPGWSHGLLVDPPGRANGTPDEDYQFCFSPPGCECGDFPDPGPIRAIYVAGDLITVTVDITVTHFSGDLFHFQLCSPDALSEQCFSDGEFASVVNDGRPGLHTYELQLPDGVICDPCVLRWEWDYGFLGCSDVRITPTGVGAHDTAWGVVKARYGRDHP